MEVAFLGEQPSFRCLDSLQVQIYDTGKLFSVSSSGILLFLAMFTDSPPSSHTSVTVRSSMYVLRFISGTRSPFPKTVAPIFLTCSQPSIFTGNPMFTRLTTCSLGTAQICPGAFRLQPLGKPAAHCTARFCRGSIVPPPHRELLAWMRCVSSARRCSRRGRWRAGGAGGRVMCAALQRHPRPHNCPPPPLDPPPRNPPPPSPHPHRHPGRTRLALR